MIYIWRSRWDTWNMSLLYMRNNSKITKWKKTDHFCISFAVLPEWCKGYSSVCSLSGSYLHCHIHRTDAYFTKVRENLKLVNLSIYLSIYLTIYQSIWLKKYSFGNIIWSHLSCPVADTVSGQSGFPKGKHNVHIMPWFNQPVMWQQHTACQIMQKQVKSFNKLE